MRVRKLMLTSTTALAAIIAVSAHAEAAVPAPSPNEVPEVVVTAQKRTQSVTDVGETIHVIGSQQLASQGVNTAADLVKVVPGFTVATNGDGTPIYTLRGVSFNSLNFATSPTVSVYLDEAPIPFSVMTEGALLDLQRVEVLKGPQGTLYGQNATGGAINYIAAKPTPDFESGFRATYERFDTFQGEGYVSGPITDNLLGRLAIGGTSSGPWQQSLTRDAQLGDQRKFAGRLLLDWRPTDRLTVNLNINGWQDGSDTQAPQLVAPKPLDPLTVNPALFTAPIGTANAQTADWDPNTKYQKDDGFIQVAARADYHLTHDITLTYLTDYTHISIHGLSDNDGTALNLSNIEGRGYVRAFSQELRLSGAFAQNRVHYIVGASYQDDASLENDEFSGVNSAQVTPFGTFDAALAHGAQSNRTVAGFANIDWSITDRFSVSAGARQTNVSHSTEGCTRDPGDGQVAAVTYALETYTRSLYGLPPGPVIAPGGCVSSGPTFLPYDQVASFTENNTSWRFNANYKFDRNALIYATVDRGFKAGNYQIAVVSSYASFPPVKQEELTAYEIGAKVEFFERRLAINAAAYYYDYKDKQLLTDFPVPLFGLQFKVENIPKSAVKGYDVDVTWIPVRGLTLKSALTFADTAVGGTAPGYDVYGDPVNLGGHPFNLAPKYISVSDAEYRQPIGASLDGFFGLSATYNSKTFSDLADSPALAIHQYLTEDLRAGIGSPSRKWEFMLWARNVANTYYWNYAVPGGDTILRYAAMPRTYGMTFSYRY